MGNFGSTGGRRDFICRRHCALLERCERFSVRISSPITQRPRVGAIQHEQSQRLPLRTPRSVLRSRPCSTSPASLLPTVLHSSFCFVLLVCVALYKKLLPVALADSMLSAAPMRSKFSVTNPRPHRFSRQADSRRQSRDRVPVGSCGRCCLHEDYLDDEEFEEHHQEPRFAMASIMVRERVVAG